MAASRRRQGYSGTRDSFQAGAQLRVLSGFSILFAAVGTERYSSTLSVSRDREGAQVAAMQAAYDEVYAYTMGRPGFILQHVVDAFGAQTATRESKPIRVVFSLVGLYLHVEKQFPGRQVQQAHVELGRRKRAWPAVALPTNRGVITALDVLATAAGDHRDKAIDEWCASVWTAFKDNRSLVIGLLSEHGIVSSTTLKRPS
jgi:hypothetical protein